MRYLSILLLLTVTGTSIHAQIYNTGVLHINSGDTISSMGDFTNTSTADYLNNGTILIDGNTVNDQASLPAGTGITIFNGSLAQTLGGAAYFRCFSITLNNSMGLTLNNRLAVGDGTGGVFSFLSGTVLTTGPTHDVYFYPGSSYTGFDATHHVLGFVTKSGNTDFTFPIGDGTHTADLDLTALSAAADFQVIYSGSGYGTYTKSLPITTNGVFDKEWWDIQQVTGTATAKVSLKWNDARTTLDHSTPATLVVGHFTAGSWQSEGGSSASPAGGSTGVVGPSNSIAAFSPFTFASTTTALPIVLGSFTAADKDCQARLTWNTQLEENAGGFDVQQSAEGVNYSSVAYVPAKGVPSQYSINVAQATKDAFYRIRMVDKDGSAAYSTIAGLQLSCITSEENLQVYPNPQIVGTDLTVKYTVPASKGAGMLDLVDMTGKRVYSAAIQVNAGINSYTIPTTSLAPGNYSIQVTGEGWKGAHAYLLLRRN